MTQFFICLKFVLGFLFKNDKYTYLEKLSTYTPYNLIINSTCYINVLSLKLSDVFVAVPSSIFII